MKNQRQNEILNLLAENRMVRVNELAETCHWAEGGRSGGGWRYSSIPKERMMDCMAEIRRAVVQEPLQCYDVIITNVCNTGADIVATGKYCP